MYTHGWFLVAYESELQGDITPAQIGAVRLMLVRNESGIRAYGADCPHRGVNLAITGRLDGDCSVICGFHGYRVTLGGDEGRVFRVPEYTTIVRGGLIFVRLSDSHDNGFTPFIESLAETHHIIPGFREHFNAPASLIIENAFDNRHFPVVHGILNNPLFDVEQTESGKVVVRSVFKVINGPAPVPYEAHTFSPGLATVHLKGKPPYSVITGATPNPDGTCTVRLSLALSKAAHGPQPNETLCRFVLEHSRRGLEEERPVWESMRFDIPHHHTAQDQAVLAYHRFCSTFGEFVPA